MYGIVLLIVLTSITTISLTAKFVRYNILGVKEDSQGRPLGAVKEWQLYVIALLGGAIGNLIFYVTSAEIREYDKSKKYRFLLLTLLCIAINALVIWLLIHFKVAKL